MTAKRVNLVFALIWLAWIAGLVPLINVLLPFVRAGDASEFAFCAALLAYFAAPFLLIAWLD